MTIHSERGSALVYILIAIALLAALTATFMDSSSQQTSSQNAFKTMNELQAQANLIRSSIQECVLSYPAGDSGITSAPNLPYPINPSSTYLTAPRPVTDLVSGLRCPGNPGNSANHAAIFGGTSGKFLPPAPSLFDPWLYYSGPDGVFFYTKTNKTDSFIQTALAKLDEQFSECEADVVDASAAARDMVSTASALQCAVGYYCFRVWMIAQPANVYNGDTDSDEAACP